MWTKFLLQNCSIFISPSVLYIHLLVESRIEQNVKTNILGQNRSCYFRPSVGGGERIFRLKSQNFNLKWVYVLVISFLYKNNHWFQLKPKVFGISSLEKKLSVERSKAEFKNFGLYKLTFFTETLLSLSLGRNNFLIKIIFSFNKNRKFLEVPAWIKTFNWKSYYWNVFDSSEMQL